MMVFANSPENVVLLVKQGARGVEGKLNQAAAQGKLPLVEAILGAAELGKRSDLLGGMDAPIRDPDDPVTEAQGEERFRQAWHQRDNTLRRLGDRRIRLGHAPSLSHAAIVSGVSAVARTPRWGSRRSG